MLRSQLGRRIQALIQIGLLLQATGLGAAGSVALAAGDTPRVVLLPMFRADGVPDRAAARFSGALTDELKTRTDDFQLVSGATAVAPARPSHGESKGGQEGKAALDQGQQLLNDLNFEEAVASLKKGIELSLSDPASTDYEKVFEAYVSLAVANFRSGQEKDAQLALFAVARLSPEYKLVEGKFPPVFVREFEKAKKRADKQIKGTVNIEGPAGSTAFLDGRDLGMVPVVEENVPVGMHYVKVEGGKGERFGQPLDLKGNQAKVRAIFAAGPKSPVVPAASAADPSFGLSVDAATVARLARFAKGAGADFAVLTALSRSGDRQLTVSTAVISARQEALSAGPSMSFDDELLTANVDAFKLAEQLVQKIAVFPAAAALPYLLAPSKAPTAPVKPVEPVVALRDPVKEPVREPVKPLVKDPEPVVAVRKPIHPAGEGGRTRLIPADPASSDSQQKDRVRALGNPSQFDEGSSRDGNPALVQSGGVAWWVWAIAGVGVAAAAGGTYYGVTQITRPVTGTVSASWQ